MEITRSSAENAQRRPVTMSMTMTTANENEAQKKNTKRKRKFRQKTSSPIVCIDNSWNTKDDRQHKSRFVELQVHAKVNKMTIVCPSLCLCAPHSRKPACEQQTTTTVKQWKQQAKRTHTKWERNWKEVKTMTTMRWCERNEKMKFSHRKNKVNRQTKNAFLVTHCDRCLCMRSHRPIRLRSVCIRELLYASSTWTNRREKSKKRRASKRANVEVLWNGTKTDFDVSFLFLTFARQRVRTHRNAFAKIKLKKKTCPRLTNSPAHRATDERQTTTHLSVANEVIDDGKHATSSRQMRSHFIPFFLFLVTFFSSSKTLRPSFFQLFFFFFRCCHSSSSLCRGLSFLFALESTTSRFVWSKVEILWTKCSSSREISSIKYTRWALMIFRFGCRAASVAQSEQSCVLFCSDTQFQESDMSDIRLMNCPKLYWEYCRRWRATSDYFSLFSLRLSVSAILLLFVGNFEFACSSFSAIINRNFIEGHQASSSIVAVIVVTSSLSSPSNKYQGKNSAKYFRFRCFV